MSVPARERSAVVAKIEELSKRVLRVYRIDPRQVREHANLERNITEGGYGDRQIYELVQNGADENIERPTDASSMIHVLLTDTHLYCANTGTPISVGGAETILRMAVSDKRAGQIGRFGVGVKSVLTISDTPRFYSVDGSFGFDKDWAERLVREAVPELPERDAVPVLRLAHPLDLEQDRAVDALLDELMEWAATTVVLPLKPGAATRLGRDIREFPAHFMLFSSHVDELVLEDARPGHVVCRTIEQTARGVERWVVEHRNEKKLKSERWFVFSVNHKPSPVAAAAAGEQHDRSVITISWAVPDKGVEERSKRGKFWAYFPTHYDTTLTGIINAPWKTPEDRQNLTKGDFNDELIGVAARLIVDSIPRLLDPEDPGSYLTLLTARGREASQWGDKDLSEGVLKVAARSRSLPDQNGVLQLPAKLRLHPEGLAPEWLARWAEYPGRPRNWCHHSVENRERRSRARDILQLAGVTPARINEWLEALVADRSIEGTRAALLIAADVIRDGTTIQIEEARTARILLADDGHFHSPAQRVVFRRSGPVRLSNDTTVYLLDDLTDDPEVREALTVLGVQEANPAGRLRAAVAAGFARYDDSSWEGFWALARAVSAVSADEVSAIVRERHPDPTRVIHVRTAGDRFKPLHDCLLAGPVVPEDASRDAGILVDPVFHAQDGDILRALGGVDRPFAGADHPSGGEASTEDAWCREYRDAMYAELCASLPPHSSMPRRSSVSVNGPAVPGPLHLLAMLSPQGRAAFVRSLPDIGAVAKWTSRRITGHGDRISVDSPLIWMLRRHGRLSTSLGVRTVTDALSPELRSVVDGALLAVAELPVGVAKALGLPARLGDVPQAMWTELAHRADNGSDATLNGAAYALLAEASPAGMLDERDRPFRCQQGRDWVMLPAARIAVTAAQEEHAALLRERVPTLLAPDEAAAQLLVDRYGFTIPEKLLVEDIRSVPLTDPVPLTDVFPRLRQRFTQAASWKLGHCSELVKIVSTPDGRREEPLTEALDGLTVLLCGERSEEDILKAVDGLLGLRLGEAGRRQLLDLQGKDEDSKRLMRVRAEPDLVTKLVLALGPDRLREALPPGLATADAQLRGRPVDGPRAAELLMAAHGESILPAIAAALSDAGFDVPRQWTGSLRAREFVRLHGFPESWAGDPETPAAPAPYETVPGPSRPLRLHDYQRELVDRMYGHLVRSSLGASGPKGEDMRAMLQIPTGSGKTRIAAEAGVRAIREGILRGPVLWITQSQELAEQAIETWAYVWRAEGSDRPLRITRLWGGTPDAVPLDGPQVVVAIDDTVVSRLPKKDYAWLRECALVFIDEAHFAVPKTYTAILDTLGIDQYRTARPLIGLTATAFRGDNETETRTLARRFGHNRLDHGVFAGNDAYGHLQRIGVLARVEQEELGGGQYVLKSHQISAMRGATGLTLPSEVLRGLEKDVARTRRIVERIEQMPAEWPVLVFATSVEHAQVLAALLTDRGRPAASIEGQTPPNVRRRRIADFRSGKLKVLTNYKVLTQGFDAPAVKAVVVARPTYSPNTYVQMIGRGLRGELNGGKDTCLILNVADNIENFGRQLAYKGMEWVWRRGGTAR